MKNLKEQNFKKKKKKLKKKIPKNKKFFTMRISTNHLNKNIHEQTSPWTKLHKHIKKKSPKSIIKASKMSKPPFNQNESLTLSHQSKIKLWPQIVQKKRRWNSWPRVIHWKPNVNESWPWVIMKRIKIRPWVKNQDLTLSHHPNSKK